MTFKPLTFKTYNYIDVVPKQTSENITLSRQELKQIYNTVITAPENTDSIGVEWERQRSIALAVLSWHLDKPSGRPVPVEDEAE